MGPWPLKGKAWPWTGEFPPKVVFVDLWNLFVDVYIANLFSVPLMGINYVSIFLFGLLLGDMIIYIYISCVYDVIIYLYDCIRKAEVVADCLRDGLILCMTQLESRLSDLHLKHLCQSHHAPAERPGHSAVWAAAASTCGTRTSKRQGTCGLAAGDFRRWDLITTEQIWFEWLEDALFFWSYLWYMVHFMTFWVHFVWSSRHDGVYESSVLFPWNEGRHSRWSRRITAAK